MAYAESNLKRYIGGNYHQSKHLRKCFRVIVVMERNTQKFLYFHIFRGEVFICANNKC